jgi:hypothetical protein
MADFLLTIPEHTSNIINGTSSINISGYTVYLTAKKDFADSIPIMNKTGVVIDSSNYIFVISSSESSLGYGRYVADVIAEKDSSIFRLAKGVIVIERGIRY